MNLTGVIYNDVQESFGMSGPFIGQLDFKGQTMTGKFLADGERLSEDKTKILFSWYVGDAKDGLFNLGTRRQFHILIYDEMTKEYSKSIETFECLAIEKMNNYTITYHEAFHTELDKYRRTMEYNSQNFEKIEI